PTSYSSYSTTAPSSSRNTLTSSPPVHRPVPDGQRELARYVAGQHHVTSGRTVVHAHAAVAGGGVDDQLSHHGTTSSSSGWPHTVGRRSRSRGPTDVSGWPVS